MAGRARQAVQAAGIEYRVIRHGPVSALSPRGPSSPAKGWPDARSPWARGSTTWRSSPWPDACLPRRAGSRRDRPRVPSSFRLTLARDVIVTCTQAVRRLLDDDRRWEVRSAGQSSKGDRLARERHRYPGPAAFAPTEAAAQRNCVSADGGPRMPADVLWLAVSVPARRSGPPRRCRTTGTLPAAG